MVRLWSTLLAAVCVLGATGCSSTAASSSAIAGLDAEERQALGLVLAEAGVDPSRVKVSGDLFDVPWRGAEFYAYRHHRPDVIDRIRRLKNDADNVIAIENGHVVAMRLGSTNLTTLARVGRLPHLVVLDIHDSAVDTLDGIGRLHELDHLGLAGNRLERLDGIGQANQIHSLYLGDNRLNEIEGLDALGSLDTLNLAGNRFTRMPDFRAFQQLHVLSLERNPISRIDGLDHNEWLFDLNLSYCAITSIENVAGMRNLRSLDLWHNQLTRLNGVEVLQNLVFLGVGENPVRFDSPHVQPILATWGKSRIVSFTW